MPHFRRVLDEYDIMCITRDEPTPFDHNIAAAILAASSFSTVKWKTEAVARVRKILERNPDKRLSMHLACREIFLTKSSKSAEESDKILQPYRDLAAAPDLNHQPKINSSYNSQRGRLVNILVGNLIRQGKLTRAREELVAWQPLQPASPSPLELLTLRSRDILLGKILRYQGKFDEALPFLQNTLKDSLHDDFSDGTSWYRTLIAGVADLYCELDRAGDAAQLLKKELDPMVERGIHNINASGRLLQTSLAETYIQRCMFEEAERLLLNLREAFAACGEAEYSAELHVFRICICLARVFHLQARWDEALSSWLSALAALQNAKLGSGPHAGIVRYSIAHALFMMGSDLESKEMVETARTNIASKPRMFRITCFNSLWQDFVVQTMDAEFAARLPGIYSNAPGF